MYRIEWIWPLVPIGFLTLLTLPLVGVVFAGLFVLLAAAIFVALIGAIVAMPFLLVRAVRRRRGRAQPANPARGTGSRASGLTAAGRQTAAPQPPAALGSSSMSPGGAVTATRVA